MRAQLFIGGLLLGLTGGWAAWAASLETRVDTVVPRVVQWRRDIHQHPELGNREFRTAALVATHLQSLGLEVRTNVAHTGVIGLLRGSRAGRVVALRADMDALPVTEQVDLPFASKQRTTWNGQEVELEGTLRALDEPVRRELHRRVRATAEGIAASAGAEAVVRIDIGNPVTFNDPELSRRMPSTLERVAGVERVREVRAKTVAEDFSHYQQVIPGMYFYLFASPESLDGTPPAPNHSPKFQVDEQALPLGVRSLAQLALDFLGAAQP